MKRPAYDTVVAVFEQAIALPAGDARAQLLTDLCAGDADLRAAVEAMLAVDAAEVDALDAIPEALARDLLTANPLKPGARLGDFTLTAPLGEGGMGEVWQAVQDAPRREVAVKVMHSWLVTDAARERFRFEAEALARLGGEGIPQVYASGEANGRLWIAMELARGPTLREHIRDRMPDAVARLTLACRIAEAVGRVHTAGVVHRDIKPSNVLVVGDDIPVILDFGVSADSHAALASHAGTPDWMSPEVRAGAPATARSDVWSLGVMTWELLVGHPPPTDDTLPDPGLIRLPPDIPAVVRKAVATDPEGRYRDARAFAADLAGAAAIMPVGAVPNTASYRLTRWTERHRVALGRLVMAGFVVCGGLVAARARDLWEMRAREAAAEAALVEAGRGATDSDAQLRAVDSAIRGFVERPEHAGTRAVPAGWRAIADIARRAGDDGPELDALARAWDTATDEDDRCRALAGLVDALSRRWRWDGAHAALSTHHHLGCTDPIDPEAALQTAVARSDLAAARTILRPGDPRAPLLDALAQVTLATTRARPFRVAGAETRILALDRDLVELARTPELRELRRWEAPGVALHWPRVAAAKLDETWIFGEAPGDKDHVTAWRLGDAALVADARIGEVSVQHTLVRATGDGPELLLAIGPYARHIAGLRRSQDGWTHRDASPALRRIGADVMGLVAADLDGDGVDEVYAALGPWHGYGVAQLADRGGVLQPTGWLGLGYVNEIAMLPTPHGPRVVALKSDRYRNPAHFGADRPWGPAAPGVWLLRADPALVPDHHVALAAPPGQASEIGYVHAFPGDFDGDGLTDLALWVDLRGRIFTWVLRQTPDAGLVGVLLPDVHPTTATDLDGDGDDELIVASASFDGPVWVLGSGAGARAAPRAAEVPTGTPPVDPEDLAAWERATVLAHMGLAERAAASLVRAASARHADASPELLVTAATLLESVGDLAGAQATLETAPPSRAVDEALVRIASGRLDVDAAAAAAARLGDSAAVGHLRTLGGPPPLDATADGYDAWALVTPDAVAPRPGGLEVAVFNGVPEAVRREVRAVAPRVGITLVAEIERPDNGVQPSVALMSGPDVVARLTVRRDANFADRANVRCDVPGADAFGDLGGWPIVPGPITVTVLRTPTAATCRFETAAGRWEANARTALAPPEPDALVIGDGSPGVYGYRATARGQIRITSITAWGVQPAPTLPTPEAWALAAGRPPPDDACGRPATCAVAAFLREDTGALGAWLRALGADEADALATRLIRQRSPHAEVLLSRAQPAERFLDQVARAWSGLDPEAPPAHVLSLIDRPWLDAMPVTDYARHKLRFIRASALIDRGEWARARLDLEALHHSEVDASLPQDRRAPAREALARALVQLGETSEARAIIAALLAEAPIPAIAYDRIASDPDLAPLLP